MSGLASYRIYIEDLVPSNVDHTLLLKYETHRRNITTFYTDSGIFRLYNSGVHQLDIEEGKTTRNIIETNNREICTVNDTTLIKIGRKQNQVPNGYIVQRIEEVSYRLEKHANTRLVIELENGKPADIYFDTTIPDHSPEVQNTIVTLLSTLKFC